ncbi:hypothetical protein PV726_24235 [Streptomyces europaeiscabiei]|uniref:hypothetical protein n=1 Tax=Streptomyces europaeiscabiei TaxID=146819 RepID=UPI0029AB6AC3|nr:hypothetical protein [Streptomyces europaeiscabiei]MDX3693400.1 hypothetical protein [Streptomyces europaeiscabiei]
MAAKPSCVPSPPSSSTWASTPWSSTTRISHLWAKDLATLTHRGNVAGTGLHDAVDDTTAYRAELSALVDQPALSDEPVLQHDLQLPDSWWQDLIGTLEKVAAADTDRVAVRRQYMDRAIPEFVGIPAPAVTRWTAAHSDLHWANVTAPLRILDCPSASCLRVTIAFLPDPPSKRIRISKIDHDVTQALAGPSRRAASSRRTPSGVPAGHPCPGWRPAPRPPGG